MKILVAGGAGMIGSHLCEQLIMEEHSVICIDNLCRKGWTSRGMRAEARNPSASRSTRGESQ